MGDLLLNSRCPCTLPVFSPRSVLSLWPKPSLEHWCHGLGGLWIRNRNRPPTTVSWEDFCVPAFNNSSPDHIRPSCVSRCSSRPLRCWPSHTCWPTWPTVRRITPAPLMPVRRFDSPSSHDARPVADSPLATDTYQSNGACIKTCSKYALGVIQGQKCWCTNVAPSEKSQESTSKCSTSCPGYPKDSCGSASEGVFAYVQVSGDPTSTAGDSSSTASSVSKTSSLPSPSLPEKCRWCASGVYESPSCLFCRFHDWVKALAWDCF